MIRLIRFGRLPMLALTVALCAAGCHKNQDQTAATLNPASAQDQTSDPASANLAPADSNAAAPASYSAANSGPAPTTYATQQSAPPPSSGGSYNQAPDQTYDQGSDDPGYGTQPVAYAPQPPPPQ